MREATISRTTRETDITVSVFLPDGPGVGPESRAAAAPAVEAPVINVETGVPFFDHMLTACAFHGGFGLDVKAVGDISVDAHHTVEDVGIVFGQVLTRIVADAGPIQRFGHSVIPMDDALGEVAIDAGGRSYLVFHADFPQGYAGTFDLALVREFMQGLAMAGQMNLHVIGRHAVNGHHLAEALFKALGRAIGQAWRPSVTVRSTKGML